MDVSVTPQLRGPFWVDENEDRDRANPGTPSRFGNYIDMQSPDELRYAVTDLDENLDPVRFAAEMWRIATGPVMSPPYVYFAPEVLSARLERNEHDGDSATAVVTLVAPLPAPLQRNRGWTGGRFWGEWEHRHGWYVGPTEESLTRRPAILPSVRLLFPIPRADLLIPDEEEIRDFGYVFEAKKSLNKVLLAMNSVVDPVIRDIGVR